jgi:hypothetical protein
MESTAPRVATAALMAALRNTAFILSLTYVQPGKILTGPYLPYMARKWQMPAKVFAGETGISNVNDR